MGTSQSVEVPSSPSASEHVSSMEIGTHGDPRTPLAPPTRPQPVEALLSLWAGAAVERNKRVAAAWRLPHMPARAPETADTRRAFPGRLQVLSCLLDRDPTYIGRYTYLLFGVGSRQYMRDFPRHGTTYGIPEQSI